MAKATMVVPIHIETQLIDECPGHHWLVEPDLGDAHRVIPLEDYNRLVRAFAEFEWAQEYLDALIDGDPRG